MRSRRQWLLLPGTGIGPDAYRDLCIGASVRDTLGRLFEDLIVLNA